MTISIRNMIFVEYEDVHDSSWDLSVRMDGNKEKFEEKMHEEKRFCTGRRRGAFRTHHEDSALRACHGGDGQARRPARRGTSLSVRGRARHVRAACRDHDSGTRGASFHRISLARRAAGLRKPAHRPLARGASVPQRRAVRRRGGRALFRIPASAVRRASAHGDR